MSTRWNSDHHNGLAQEAKTRTLQLLHQYRTQPALTLRNQIVELNLGLVRQEAHRLAAQVGVTYDDLSQVGMVGLIRAIERFDLDRGCAFSSFAIPYIRGEMQHYLRDQHPTVRLPRRWCQLQARSTAAIAHLQATLDRPPTDVDIAQALNLTIAEWQQVKLAKSNQTVLSLDAPIYSEDQEAASLGALLPEAPYRSFQLAPEDQLWLQLALQQLEQRTREIIEYVFLQDLTQQETAAQLGISPVTVSRRLKRGLAQLRQLLVDPPT